MKRTFCLLLLWTALLPLRAQAMIPMRLDAEVTLPNNTSWDLQRLDNDSTYAIVWALNNLISYRETPSGPTQQFLVPDSIFRHYPDHWISGGSNVIWVKLATVPDHRCVLWSIRMTEEYGDQNSWSYNVVALVDLTARALVDTAQMFGGADDGCTSSWSVTTIMMVRPRPWPPLPAATRFVYFIRSFALNHYSVEDYHGEAASGQLSRMDIQTGTFANDFELITTATSFSFFTDTTNRRLAYSNLSWSYGGHTYDPDYPHYLYSVELGIASVDSGVVSRDTLRGPAARAQQDLSGVRRIITSGGLALHADTYDSLWKNPAIRDNAFIAKPYAHQGDWIISQIGNTSHYGAYQGMDGALIDTVAAISGPATSVLKGFASGDAIVTYTEATRTVRAYRFALPESLALTGEYDPDSRVIVLRWQPVPWPTFYNVWITNLDTNLSALFGTTISPIYTIPPSAVPPWAHAFYVTYLYGQ